MGNDVENQKCEMERSRLKLHLKYILVICVTLFSIVLVAATKDNSNFVSEVSFAATISSIILSVIAILMTIIGELKSENVKDKLTNVSDTLISVTKSIKESAENLHGLSQVNVKINKLDDIICRIDNLGGQVNDTKDMMIGYFENDKPEKKMNIQVSDINFIDLYKIHIITLINLDDSKDKIMERSIEKIFCSSLYYAIMAREKEGKVYKTKYIETINHAFGSKDQVNDFTWGMVGVFLNYSKVKDSKFKEFITDEIGSKYPEQKKIIDDYME